MNTTMLVLVNNGLGNLSKKMDNDKSVNNLYIEAIEGFRLDIKEILNNN